MDSVYARIAKINNVVGRSDYLTDPERQEEIVLHKCNMRYDWKIHSNFEKENQKTNVKNNEALEIHIALPNALSSDTIKLEKICDELVMKIVGENKDYEYAVHWNSTRTNLHMHMLFSERKNNLEVKPKIYKKDIWHDKDTHKLAKANSENAILVHKKGDIQRDSEGNIKYDIDIFTVKDKRFIESSFVHEKNRIIKNTLNAYGFEVEYREKQDPYLSQKKLYKGASQDYLDKAKAWNEEVKKYNATVKEHIDLEPYQTQNYIAIKQDVLTNVKEANAEEKKITERAIELVREMGEWAKDNITKFKAYIKHRIKNSELIQSWHQVANKFNDFFKQDEILKQQIKEDQNKLNHYQALKEEYKKEELIKEKLVDVAEKSKQVKEMEYEMEMEEDYGMEM